MTRMTLIISSEDKKYESPFLFIPAARLAQMPWTDGDK